MLAVALLIGIPRPVRAAPASRPASRPATRPATAVVVSGPFPGRPCWVHGSGAWTLDFDLRLAAPTSGPVKILFAQAVWLRGSKLLRVTTWPAAQLAGSVIRLGAGGRADSDGLVPERGATALPFRLVVPFARVRPDRLVLAVHFLLSGRRIGRRILVKPRARGCSVRLALPVQGRWWVAAGSGPGEPHRRSVVERNGRLYNPYRNALDLVRIGPRGWLHRGEPGRMASYHGFGAPVRAPSRGAVVRAVDGLPDRRPTGSQPASVKGALGNHLVIKLEPGVFCVLAHLKKGSIRVKAGERVRDGQLVAQVGSSGASDMPHLHLHIAATADPSGPPGPAPVFTGILPVGGGRVPFCPDSGEIVRR